MKRFLSALVLAGAAALGTLPALAQQQPQAPQQAPAVLPQPSPSHFAAARDVVLVSGMTRSFDAILPRFFEGVRQQAVTRPELTKDLTDVLDKLKPEMELQKQQMVNITARVFATQMSEQELKDTATFFKSPAGQKYVLSQPAVLDEMVRQMEVWTRDVSEYVMIRVRAEMGKRGHLMQ
jgi:hypothetical protein